MWKKSFENRRANYDYRINDFAALLRYVDYLASHKMGYPVSLLTYMGIVNNQILGIKRGSLANVLLNNVGDPFKDSETSLLEVKKHEREIIAILEKYYGLPPNEARGYVTTGGTEGNFAALWWSKRYLINRAIDQLIAADDEIKLLTKQEQDLSLGLTKILNNDFVAKSNQLQNILDIKQQITDKKNIVQQLLTPTVYFARNHTHYSVPKISEILHLNIKPVEANPDGSINLDEFKKELLLNLGAYPHSAIAVIANIGTTVTGAIDDVLSIKKIIEKFAPNVPYTIHMDGALTGFVLPILKPFGDEVKNYFSDLGVNTLAFSAHKYPGLSQPCGIILASKHFFEKAFEKSERNIEYVGNILDVTVSGSRSGLNVLMFYNALCSLGLDKDTNKLERLVHENLETARYLYQQLGNLFGKDKIRYAYQFNVSFPRPSQELARKYQLMLTGESATICVLSNVTRELINEFIEDLKIDKETAMSHSTVAKDYTIKNLSAEYVNAAITLFTKSFCDSEPITKFLGAHYQDYEPFAREVVQKALKEGMSKVAVNKDNKVVGVAIAEDLADPFIPHVAHYPKLRPIFILLKQLSAPFLKGRKFIRGKIAHIWIVAVDPAYRGVGLSTEINMACVDSAARRGFDFAYAEFTNDISEHITSQFKILQLYNRIPYDTFELDDGTKPFAGLKGAAASYLATIRPGVNLDSLTHAYHETETF